MRASRVCVCANVCVSEGVPSPFALRAAVSASATSLQCAEPRGRVCERERKSFDLNKETLK